MGNAVAAMAAYQGGGKVKGPGTGTSDSVPVRLSKGEFVIPADSVKKIGAHTLHALVAATHKHVTPKGKAPVRKMANGGVVGDAPPVVDNSPMAIYNRASATYASMNNPGAPAAPAASPVVAATPAVGAATAGVAAPLNNADTRAASIYSDIAAKAATGAYGDGGLHFANGGMVPAVRRMVNGGGVGDDTQKPTAYGQPSVSPASAMASSAWRAATALGADTNSPLGFGASRAAAAQTAAPTSAAAALASPTVGAGRGVVNPAPVVPQIEGSGRGTVNPPLASQTGDARPDLANVPSLGGSTGTAVDGAPGVRKFVTGDGRTLYSNVAGSDNDKLMSGNPGVQTAPAISTASTAPSTGAQAALAAPATSYIPGVNAPLTQYQQDLTEHNAGVTSVFANSGISAREQSRIAAQRDIAAEQSATSRANAQTGAAAQLGTANIGAGASMYGADTGARTAVQRLAQEAPEVQARTAELGAQAKLRQGTAVAQQALLAAKTPEERQVAEENLRATLGKDHVVRGIAVNLPAQENGLPGGGAVWDDRTQTFRYPERQETAAPSAPPANHIANLRANPGTAAQFDAKYGKGAAAKYLGPQ